MKLNVGNMRDAVKRVVLQAPVELVESLFFYALYEICSEAYSLEKIAFFPIIFFISLAANVLFGEKSMRWAYYASVVTAVPVMIMPMEQYVLGVGYFFGIYLSVSLVLLSVKSDCNTAFARNLTKLVIDVAFSVVVTTVSALVLSAIFGTLSYIFGLWTSWFRHIPLFLYLVILPMVFCYFRLSRCDDKWQVPKFVNVLINFIVCPAVIIYTVILYAYLIKIAVVWELPKGGLAAMILTFYVVALGGKLFQYVAPRKFYSWFYDNFQYISLPLMVLFWAGLVYRINQYSFTESRIYLVVAGVAMLAFSVMMMTRRFTDFKLMLVMASGAIALFTYIPGLSAKSMGIKCQEARMVTLAKSLNVYDETSGKLKTEILDKLPDNEQVSELVGCYYYLENNMGQENAIEKYGKYSETQYVRPSESKDDVGDTFSFEKSASYDYSPKSIDCGEYHYFLNKAYVDLTLDGYAVVKMERRILLREKMDINKFKEAYAEKGPIADEFLDNSMELHNDSVKVVFRNVLFDGSHFYSSDDGCVFSKNPIK